jgi:hypothetical protein
MKELALRELVPRMKDGERRVVLLLRTTGEEMNDPDCHDCCPFVVR